MGRFTTRARESEFDLALNLLMNCSTLVGGPDLCLFRSPLSPIICPSNICPIGVRGSLGPLGTMSEVANPWEFNDASSIDLSIVTEADFFPGFLIPETSDFDRGRNVSKNVFTFDWEGELTLPSSPEAFRCFDLLLNNPFNPVEPDRGRNSWSTSIALPSVSESNSGIANALRSWNDRKRHGQTISQTNDMKYNHSELPLVGHDLKYKTFS